jgi:hypothetical protein
MGYTQAQPRSRTLLPGTWWLSMQRP